MKDLLLIFPPPGGGNYINIFPPMGILYLASFLEKEGFSVDVVDCAADSFSARQAAGYRTVGVSLNISNVESGTALLNEIHRLYPAVELVAGGPLPTVSPEVFFPLPLKAIFVSEAEESLLAYLRYPGGADNKGYYFRDASGWWRFNGRRPYIKDLDKLPFPALNKLNIGKYYTPVRRSTPVSALISSRGCPFECGFCCHVLGEEYRARSAENVVDEIEWQVKELGANEIALYDDNFTLDRQRVMEICLLLLHRRVKVSLQLTNGVRADTLDEELLRTMKSAGVWMIALAPESGSGATLARIHKGFSAREVEKGLSLCRRLGINTWVFFILGFPWEKEEDFAATVKAACSTDADIVHFSRFVPLPGTPLYALSCPVIPSQGMRDADLFSASGRSALTARAYRSVYLRRPLRLLRLLRICPFLDIFGLILHAFRTRNVF